MFLNLDQKPPQSLAAVDDSRVSVTYGDTVSFAGTFGNVLPERTLIFIMATNTVGSLLGYTSCLSNGIVPLILSAHTEKRLDESLRDLYRPEYLWIPA